MEASSKVNQKKHKAWTIKRPVQSWCFLKNIFFNTSFHAAATEGGTRIFSTTGAFQTHVTWDLSKDALTTELQRRGVLKKINSGYRSSWLPHFLLFFFFPSLGDSPNNEENLTEKNENKSHGEFSLRAFPCFPMTDASSASSTHTKTK